MSDIVERLRANMDKYPGFENMNTEAAAEITRLRARVAELEAEVSMLQREVSREARLRHQLHGVLKEHEFFIRTERKADDAARAANGEVGQ